MTLSSCAPARARPLCDGDRGLARGPQGLHPGGV